MPEAEQVQTSGNYEASNGKIQIYITSTSEMLSNRNGHLRILVY